MATVKIVAVDSPRFRVRSLVPRTSCEIADDDTLFCKRSKSESPKRIPPPRCFGSSKLAVSAESSPQGPRPLLRKDSAWALFLAKEQEMIAMQQAFMTSHQKAFSKTDCDLIFAAMLKEEGKKQQKCIEKFSRILERSTASQGKDEEKVREIQDRMDNAMQLWSRLQRYETERRRSSSSFSALSGHDTFDKGDEPEPFCVFCDHHHPRSAMCIA